MPSFRAHIQGSAPITIAEIVKGKAIISVPEGMDFVPPDTTPLKMSEYWAIKEGAAA